MVKTTNIAVFGEALIDLIEQDNGLFKPCIGGSPFNVALALARLSVNSHYLAPISTDSMGQRIRAYAIEQGIKLSDTSTSDKNTSLALVYTDSQGQPDYNLYRQSVADLDISEDALIKSLPKDLSLFHTGSLALIPQTVTPLVKLFKRLKQRHVPISIDVNMRKCEPGLKTAYIESVTELMEYANYLKLSDEDINALVGNVNYLDFCKQLLNNGTAQLIALTEGAKGATLITKAHSVQIPVVTPPQLCDTVGAGDTYFSALISYLVKHQMTEYKSADFSESQLYRLNNFASIAASINVSRTGCNPPVQDEIVKFAQQNSIDI